MSIELPSLETTNPPRVESTRWRKFGPYLVLISVITLVVAFSTPTPEPVVEIPIPRPPALDESDAQKLRGGFWNVEEMWLGAKLEFSEQAEIKCLSLATDRLERGEPPITARFSYRLARLTPHNTLEISSQQHESTNRVRTSKRLMTEVVFITRFDPEGMGTVNALPIAWNEEKDDVLHRLDAGESLKGLYAFNGSTMQVFLPGDTGTPRPAAIPKTLNPADRLFKLRRYSEKQDGRVYYPQDWPPKFRGTILKISAGGIVDYRSEDGHDMMMRVEELPQPIRTPIEQAVDPPRTKRTFTFCHTNGWILQTEPPLNPPVIPPLPSGAPHPAIQWLHKQVKKLP